MSAYWYDKTKKNYRQRRRVLLEFSSEISATYVNNFDSGRFVRVYQRGGRPIKRFEFRTARKSIFVFVLRFPFSNDPGLSGGSKNLSKRR